jgi:hypothetical protein
LHKSSGTISQADDLRHEFSDTKGLFLANLFYMRASLRLSQASKIVQQLAGQIPGSIVVLVWDELLRLGAVKVLGDDTLRQIAREPIKESGERNHRLDCERVGQSQVTGHNPAPASQVQLSSR